MMLLPTILQQLMMETTTAVDDAITNNPIELMIETTTAVGDAITNNSTAVDDRNYNSSW
jgi:hypothetical protein